MLRFQIRYYINSVIFRITMTSFWLDLSALFRLDFGFFFFRYIFFKLSSSCQNDMLSENNGKYTLARSTTLFFYENVLFERVKGDVSTLNKSLKFYIKIDKIGFMFFFMCIFLNIYLNRYCLQYSSVDCLNLS